MTHVLATETGTLYIVATPIGNREDITFRALETLKSVDLILAEDTRHSLQLLSALGIKNRVESLHSHNENTRSQRLIAYLESGRHIALISDAGTPLISDPGYVLVKAAHHASIKVVPIPGACALITALSAAGIPCDRFLFLGFLPAKQAARQSVLKSFKNANHTLVFYESTHRLMESLTDIQAIYGEGCEMVLAKELTKSFEQFAHGTVCSIQHWLHNDLTRCKGEFVLLIAPQEQVEHHEDEHLLRILLEELSLKQAVSIASKLSSTAKNELYEKALLLKK